MMMSVYILSDVDLQWYATTVLTAASDSYTINIRYDEVSGNYITTSNPQSNI